MFRAVPSCAPESTWTLWTGGWAMSGLVGLLLCLAAPSAEVLLTNPDPASSLLPTTDSPLMETSPAATSPSAKPSGTGPNTNAFSTLETLDDKRRLSRGDRLSFWILEDLEDPKEPVEPKLPVVTDSGDVELPYLGRFPALAKTCRQLALEIKAELEKTYYYQASPIVALDLLAKTTGKVYLVGQLRVSGALEIPGDEVFTLSKAILRAGGFTEFADKRRVKLTRRGDGERDGSGSEPGARAKPKTFVVNVNEILEEGRSDGDLTLEPGDLIFVPSRLVNF